jgi:hypothetical protein
MQELDAQNDEKYGTHTQQKKKYKEEQAIIPMVLYPCCYCSSFRMPTKKKVHETFSCMLLHA